MKSTAKALVLAGILIAACSPTAHTITGTVSFPGFKVDQWCKGSAVHGTQDLELGMQVVVVDGTGKTIATGQMTNTSMIPGSNEPGAIQGTCSGEFSIEQVPDADFYELRLGARKTEQYTKADLEAGGWNLAFDIE